MIFSRLLLLSIAAFLHANQSVAETQASAHQPIAQPIIRTEGGMQNLSLSPNHRFLAFTNAKGQSLRILDLGSQDVIEVTEHKTGPGFFWSPDGIRLFFRELIRDGAAASSDLSAYDTVLNQKLVLDHVSGSSGFPMLNPYDNTLTLLHEKGILQKRLEFPGERPAKWQKQKKTKTGSWVASQGGVLWLGELGLELKKMADDGSGLSSYALSPDGRRIAWATLAGKIYAAWEGEDVMLVGEGKDPSWHPYRTLLVYAASRKIGSLVYNYDLCVTDLRGITRWLTQTQDLAERWPVWLDAKTLLYTADGTTDLFKLDFQDAPPLATNRPKQGNL